MVWCSAQRTAESGVDATVSFVDRATQEVVAAVVDALRLVHPDALP